MPARVPLPTITRGLLSAPPLSAPTTTFTSVSLAGSRQSVVAAREQPSQSRDVVRRDPRALRRACGSPARHWAALGCSSNSVTSITPTS